MLIIVPLCPHIDFLCYFEMVNAENKIAELERQLENAKDKDGKEVLRGTEQRLETDTVRPSGKNGEQGPDDRKHSTDAEGGRGTDGNGTENVSGDISGSAQPVRGERGRTDGEGEVENAADGNRPGGSERGVDSGVRMEGVRGGEPSRSGVGLDEKGKRKLLPLRCCIRF